MSFNMGTPKSTSTFALPTATSAAAATPPTFQFGSAGGDAKTTKLTFAGFATPSSSTSEKTSVTTGATTGGSTTVTAGTTGAATVNFSSFATTAPSTLFTVPEAQTTTSLTTSSVPGLTASISTTKPTVASTATFSFGTTTTSTTSGTSLITPSSTAAAAAATSSQPTAAGILSFAQLEDSINKWTIDLEEQGKHFVNQAKQINAWDRLLITNGEKILTLNSAIERVKHQQEQLDQELDFVLAQQKELEDLIVPLEKELADIPVTDLDRNYTYQMAESLDSQLKQMSEDLKEIIEHLNEANKNQELSNPITQIGRILNAHMNSLQWIDRNTTKITSHLDQIAKMHDMNRRNHEINLQKTYE